MGRFRAGERLGGHGEQGLSETGQPNRAREELTVEHVLEEADRDTVAPDRMAGYIGDAKVFLHSLFRTDESSSQATGCTTRWPWT